MADTKQPEPPNVRLIHHSYQPSKAKLEQDHRVDATFEEIAKAVTRTVKVEFYKPPKRRRQGFSGPRIARPAVCFGTVVYNSRGNDCMREKFGRVRCRRALPPNANVVLLLTLLASASAGAAERLEGVRHVPAPTNGHGLIVMPSDVSAAGAIEVDGVLLSVEVDGGFRVYRATRDGQTRTARQSIEGSPRYFAYDPKRHRFGRLAPTLRVELRDYDMLPEIVRTAGGTGSKVFELLGFAVVYLPAEVSPVTAMESVERLPGVISARPVIRTAKRVPR